MNLTLQDKVRLLLKNLGCSQYDLAAMMNASQSIISKYVGGTRGIKPLHETLVRFQKVAKQNNIDINFLE